MSNDPGAFAAGTTLIMLFIGFIGLLLMGFWIWMLIDAINKEPSEGNDRIVWIIVIVLLGWLGALIYLIARRPKRIEQYGR